MVVYLHNLPNRVYHLSYDSIEEKQISIEMLSCFRQATLKKAIIIDFFLSLKVELS